MISAARFPYLSILSAAALARSRLGGSCASHSRQLLALVMAIVCYLLERLQHTIRSKVRVRIKHAKAHCPTSESIAA
jgi:hypothetical protein